MWDGELDGGMIGEWRTAIRGGSGTAIAHGCAPIGDLLRTGLSHCVTRVTAGAVGRYGATFSSPPSSSYPPSPPPSRCRARHRPEMALKQPCVKYQYVVTPTGPKILPVDEPSCKDEESPADYNVGGYLPVKIGDGFKHGRYRVVRKLGCVSFPFFSLTFALTCILCLKLGSLFDCVACERHSVSAQKSFFHLTQELSS